MWLVGENHLTEDSVQHARAGARESMFPREREGAIRLANEGTVLPKHLRGERRKKRAVKAEKK